MKTRKLNHRESVLLFFGDVKYVEYRESANALMSYLLSSKGTLTELVFSNQKGLFLDNKVSEPVFMALDDVIINNYNFHQEKYLMSVNWEAKLFYYCEKQYDITFYHIIGGSKAIKDFLRVYNFKSWSIRRNLTKKERKFIFKFCNGLFKNRYSYNLSYWEELQDDIKELKYQIYELECIKELVGLTLDELEELEELEEKLNAKIQFEDKLLYSLSEE